MSRTIRLLLVAVLAVSLAAAASCGPTAPLKPHEGHGFFSTYVPDVRKIVYIVNRSDGMSDSFGHVKQEFRRCLRELSPDEALFQIIFCSPGPAIAMPPGKLVPPTEESRQAAFKFIDAVKPQGKTDPSDALRKAFALKPDTIYFLTDGPVDPAITKTIRDLNPDKKACLHTRALLCRDAEELLRTLAAENGGTYRFVSEADLAELSKEPEPPSPAKPKEGAAAPQQ